MRDFPIIESNSSAVAALAAELLRRCDRLAAFTEVQGQITRPFLCASARDVHTVMSEWMREAGCSDVRVDAVGNLIGKREASTGPDAPALVIASHLDTVPNAGRYDGILGVLLGVAVVEATREAALPFALEIVGFSEEEGVRFGVPYLGSRAYTGTFDPALLERRDVDGISVADAVRAFGLDPAEISSAVCLPENLLGYVEAHIEQGPVLERENQALGVVDVIAGQSRLTLRFLGQAGHAGTTPMGKGAMRRDALAGAAAFVLAVEALGEFTPGLVATVGRIQALPGTGNVIPGEVELSLDVRHAQDAARIESVEKLRQQAAQIARERGLQFTVLSEVRQSAVPMDERLSGRLAKTVKAVTGQTCSRLISGAGHDAAILAPHTPSALLFLRSPKAGLSHHPDEAVGSDDVEATLRALISFVLSLMKEPLL